jgi:hypothetical protein
VSEREDGFYQGRIIGTHVEEDAFNANGLVACFTVEIENDEYVCKHQDGAGDPKAKERCEQVFAALELPFPDGFRDLSPVVGKEVRVRLKTNTKGTRQNAYIATSRAGKVLSADEINKRLDADTIPF